MAETKKSKMGLIIGLIVAVVVLGGIAFLMTRKPKPVESTEPEESTKLEDTGCKTSVSEWNAAIQKWKDAIEADDKWKGQVLARAVKYGMTYEARKALEAAAMVKDHNKLCKPE